MVGLESSLWNTLVLSPLTSGQEEHCNLSAIDSSDIVQRFVGVRVVVFLELGLQHFQLS
jgi:hypothetical protein